MDKKQKSQLFDLDFIESIQRGLNQSKRNQVTPHNKVIKQLRKHVELLLKSTRSKF